MSNLESPYRLRLAKGSLDEASQDIDLNRWRSALNNSQLSVEHAAKAVLALLGPVGRTHNPAVHLREALEKDHFSPAQAPSVQALTEKSELLGPDVHIQTDYGDEVGGLTPWELFDESDARQALTLAEEAVTLADQIIQEANHE